MKNTRGSGGFRRLELAADRFFDVERVPAIRQHFVMNKGMLSPEMLTQVIDGSTALRQLWTTWCSRGRYALVVYSNSPIWQEYFEKRVLSAVGDRGLVLNWSERKHWSYSLPVALFRFFGGTREFNPLAIVFQPLTWPRRFRFYSPFKAFKHGRPQEVEEMRREVLELLDRLAPLTKGA